VIPPVTRVHFTKTHRLIPTKESAEGSVLGSVSDDAQMLAELAELDGATNERLLAEQGLAPGIGVHELVFGVRYASVVNASFTHRSPWGGRFNDGTRGAWYAALRQETSIQEVSFHKARHLADAGWSEEEVSEYDDYLADFNTEFHDLRLADVSTGSGAPASAGNKFKKYLKPGPVPECYGESQQLARELLARQSNGVVYPSVRQAGGTCLACFRPVLVYNPRRGGRLEMRLSVEGASIKLLHVRRLSAE
jgi:RES domain-containing protein